METTLTLPLQLPQFDPASKVWIYQSSRVFTPEEAYAIRSSLQQFAMQWTAHNRQLKAEGQLLFDRVIVLVVDETQAGASGCSIDTSVHFIRSLETQYQVQLFDRMIVNYYKDAQWRTTSLPQLSELFAAHTINQDTIVLDPLSANLKALQEHGLVALGDSWMSRFLN